MSVRLGFGSTTSRAKVDKNFNFSNVFLLLPFSGRTVDREEMKFYTVEINYSRWEVPERYDSFQSLGYDTHGQLCEAIDKQSQESVVIKKLNRPFDSLISCINTFREMRLLKHTKHDTIIHFHDLFTPQKTLREFSSVYLVYKSLPPPYVSLEHILSTQITDDHLKFVAYALFRALLYLHSMELVLLDLAPQHIFVNESVELQIQNLASARKVGVYGPYDNKMSGYLGLRWYRAPEMILNIGHYDGKVDVWSVGCILYKLATGKVLFPGKHHINQLTVIIDFLGTPNKALIEKCSFEGQRFLSSLPLKERRDLSEYLQPSNASAGFVAFLERILVMDPSERISAAEALRDPYLEEYHDPDDEPLAEPFDDSFEQWKDLGKDEWKERIFDEIRNFVA